MRTLAQIRAQKKPRNLLFVGMEETPVHIPSDVREEGKALYIEFVKPTSRRVLGRYFEKTKE